MAEVTNTQEPLRGRDALKDLCIHTVPLGKRPQTKGAVANPKSKHFNPKVASNRRKNKERRKFNARMRARSK